MTGIGKLLLLAGAVLVAVGALLMLGARIPFLGRLPGDIRIERPGFGLYVPITTSLVVSAALTLLLRWILRR